MCLLKRYIDVGDRKFISRNPEGLGCLITFLTVLEGCDTSSRLNSDTLFCNVSGTSSVITLTDCEKPFCFFNSPDSIQPVSTFSGSNTLLEKYLFNRLLLGGEEVGVVNGDVGSDLLPLLIEGLKSVGLVAGSSSTGMKPRVRFLLTIWWATLITDVPHAAPSPLKPSSVPTDFTFIVEFTFTASDGAIPEK